MKSPFFYGGHYKAIATLIKDYINSVPEFLSTPPAQSTRAVGFQRKLLINTTSLVIIPRVQARFLPSRDHSKWKI